MDEYISMINSAAEGLDVSHGALLIVSVVSSLLTVYSNTVKKLKCNLTELINKAEIEFAQWDSSGTLKRTWVINQLRDMLSPLFRPFFPYGKLEMMVDDAFGNVAKFAELRGLWAGQEENPDMPEPPEYGASVETYETAPEGYEIITNPEKTGVILRIDISIPSGAIKE